jgi:hypothetical protein
MLRRVWRYQRGNQNQYIEEEQTTQWPTEKGQTIKTYRLMSDILILITPLVSPNSSQHICIYLSEVNTLLMD